MPSLIIRIAIVPLFLVLNACSGGTSSGSSPMIGPAGGQVVSFDGKVCLIIPPNAVTEPQQFDLVMNQGNFRDFRLALAGVEDATYRPQFPPSFQGTATIVFKDTSAPSSIAGGLKARFLTPTALRAFDMAGNPVGPNDQLSIPSFEMNVDVVNNSAEIRFDIDQAIDEVGLGNRVSEVSPVLTAPTILPVGGTGTVNLNVSIDATSTSDFSTSSNVWTTTSDPSNTIQFTNENETSFANGVIFSVPGTISLQDQRDVTCLAPGTGDFDVSFTARQVRFSVVQPGGGTILTAPTDATVRFRGQIQCMGGGGNPTANVFPIPGLSTVESMSMVDPSEFPFADLGAGNPRAVLFAGNGGAVVMNPTNGSVIQSYPFTGSFFDAQLLSPTNPSASIGGLVRSGQGFANTIVDRQNGTQAGLTQVDPIGQIFSDLSPLGASSANGALLVNATGITHIFNDGVTNLGTSLYSTTNTINQSAVALPALQSALVTRVDSTNPGTAPGTLVYVDLSANPPTEIIVGSLGISPRRMRWDAQSNVGAISNFGDNTVTVFTWDGISLPVITDTETVGSGPLGLDVRDQQILVQGFNDNSVSLITVDNLGIALQNQVKAAPAGITGPGHVKLNGSVTNGLGFVITGSTSANAAFVSDLIAFFNNP